MATFLEKLKTARLGRIAFESLCGKYGVDSQAPDALHQVDLKLSELGRPLNPLTEERVNDYIRG
ncbi:MAG TPA: hypothetical protein V6D17_02630 [Candidatus Obscuribacterales bacterium]